MTARVFYHKETGAPVQIIARAQTKPTYQEVICYQELDEPYDHFVMEKTHFFSEYVKEFVKLPVVERKALEKRDEIEEKTPEPAKEPEKEPEEELSDIVKAMLAFLDAETYREKIKILQKHEGEWEEYLLNNMAASLDLPVEGEQDQYELILSELSTRQKYESSRGERL